MDLNTVTAIKRPTSLDEVPDWQQGYAWLAGGTWLFSEPQVQTHTLIDLETLQWPSLTLTDEGLEIAATCRVIELETFQPPADWLSGPVLSKCCRSFLSSFKIWNEATVGGNICMSLPASPMVSLVASLEGVLTLWPRQGEPRQVNAIDFVTGVHANILAPGEILRSVLLPTHVMRKKFAFQRFTLTQQGRSEVLIVGTLCPEHGEFVLTISAATTKPVQIQMDHLPSATELKEAIDRAVPFELYLDDVHGSPPHRKHLTYYFSEQIREELS
jgi:CO/xanthine dehydrogenase FAD-binding subunit